MRAPKAQVSARKRSGKRTAGFEGGLWRAMAVPRDATIHRRGAVRAVTGPISQVQGQRGGGKGIGPESRFSAEPLRISLRRAQPERFSTKSRFGANPPPAAFFIGAARGIQGEVFGQTYTSL